MQELSWNTWFARCSATALPLAAVVGAVVLIRTLLKSKVRSKPLGRQILGVIVVETALSAWIYLAPCAYFGTLIVIGDPQFCGSWFYLQLWLVFASLLTSAFIALGVWFAICNFQKAIPALQASPIIALVLSTALVLPMVNEPVQYFANNGFPYCQPNRAVTNIIVAMFSLLIVVMLIVEILVLCHSCRNTAFCTRRVRSIRNASMYLILSLMSYVPFNVIWIRHALEWDVEQDNVDHWIANALWALFRSKCWLSCATLWWTLKVAEGAMNEQAVEDTGIGTDSIDSWTILGFDLDCEVPRLRLNSILYDSFEGVPVWWRRPRSMSSVTTTVGSQSNVDESCSVASSFSSVSLTALVQERREPEAQLP